MARAPKNQEAAVSASDAASNSTTTEEAAVAETTAFQITLKEYMVKLSLRDKRVELINAFNFTEKQAGHVKDYESEFDSRFLAFTQQVVEG